MVGGITLGILVLFGVQFLIPYVLGPWGLIVVLVLDLLLFLVLRPGRARRKPSRSVTRITWGPVDRRYVSHDKHPLETEVAATFLFAAFLVVIYAVGVGIRVDSLVLSPNLLLYLVGSLMTTFAWLVLRLWHGANRSLESESEKYDTTEDH